MLSKLASSLFHRFPENDLKNHLRAFIYRLRYNEYKTYYRNKTWELHYPGFVIRYNEIPSPASTNYLFFKKFTDRKFDIIIDGGGYVGTYGFVMANKYPNAKVYIFEADPMNFKKMKANLALNNLPNVVIEPVGLWDKPGKLKMHTGIELSSSLINQKTAETSAEIDVTSLDAYFNNEKGKLVFIKMNIEGAEIAALQGASGFLTNNKTELALSTDHIVDGELTYITVEKILNGLGMRTETLRETIYINTFASNIPV